MPRLRFGSRQLLQYAQDANNAGSLKTSGRDAFLRARLRQNPDMRAPCNSKTDRQRAMRTGPDEFLVAKAGKESYA